MRSRAEGKRAIQTTPLVCCLAMFCRLCWWCVMHRGWCACIVFASCFLFIAAPCVRARGGGRSRACVRVWRLVTWPHASVSVVCGGDGPCLSSRSPPKTRHRHQAEAGIDTHSAYRACTPPLPPARQSGGTRRNCFRVTITITNHEHGAGRPDGPQSRKQTLQQTQTRGASCAIGGARVDLAAVATAFPGQTEVKSCCCCPPPPP